MEESYKISLNGLTSGKREYLWKAGKEFFAGFDNSEVLDAELDIKTAVEKSGSYIGVDVIIEGEVTVACDRCLEDLDIPIYKAVLLSVKFGQEPVSPDAELQKDGRELVYLPDISEDLDLSQVIYDYACLEIPMHRVHEDGQCNPQALKYISQETSEVPPAEINDSPFAALKGLFE